jgi:hypothetical protein
MRIRTSFLLLNIFAMTGLVFETSKVNAATEQSLITGEVHGPVNASLILQNQHAEDLPLLIKSNYGSPYDILTFNFPTPKDNGSSYSLTIKEQGNGLTCSVYKGQIGVLPITPNSIKIGCEKTYEYVSLGNTPSERGTYYYSSNPATGGSNLPVGRTSGVYGEGRFVAFSSSLPLAGSKGLKRQVFFRDRMTGMTFLISKDKNGVEGNGDSTNPTISADGLTVAFESYATNLDGLPDTNGMRDIFTWSALMNSDAPVKVSLGINGVEANSESFDPTLSGDGDVIAFSSSASNITPGVVGTGTVNVYRREINSKLTTLISADQKGLGTGGLYPSISEDGNKIAFYSFSSKITLDDTNNLWDIFVYNHTNNSYKRVSLTSTGAERNSGTESVSHTVPPSISGNGRYVAFSTTATNMVPGDDNGKRDVFVADTDTGTVQWASAGIRGAAGNGNSPVGQSEKIAISYDGRWVSYTTNSGNLYGNSNPGNENIIMRNLDSGLTKAITNKEGYSFGAPVISHDGTYIVFGSSFRFDDDYPSSGFFSNYTGLNKAFMWIDF